MMQFAQVLPNEQIVVSVMRQLSWTHILQVLPLKDDLQREFYLTFAASERWSVRRLRKEIDGRGVRGQVHGTYIFAEGWCHVPVP